jgi:hypothetical protein
MERCCQLQKLINYKKKGLSDPQGFAARLTRVLSVSLLSTTATPTSTNSAEGEAKEKEEL